MADAHERQDGNSARERADISVRGIVIAGALIIGAVIFAVLASGGLNALLRSRVPAAASAPAQSVQGTPPGRGRPVTLEADPRRDLARFRAAKRARLESYGWVARDAGIVHIPIERAMELVLAESRERGGSEGAPHESATPQQQRAGADFEDARPR